MERAHRHLTATESIRARVGAPCGLGRQPAPKGRREKAGFSEPDPSRHGREADQKPHGREPGLERMSLHGQPCARGLREPWPPRPAPLGTDKPEPPWTAPRPQAGLGPASSTFCWVFSKTETAGRSHANPTNSKLLGGEQQTQEESRKTGHGTTLLEPSLPFPNSPPLEGRSMLSLKHPACPSRQSAENTLPWTFAIPQGSSPHRRVTFSEDGP